MWSKYENFISTYAHYEKSAKTVNKFESVLNKVKQCANSYIIPIKKGVFKFCDTKYSDGADGAKMLVFILVNIEFCGRCYSATR